MIEGQRVAMVTGASEGVGEAIAARLVREGYRTAMLARGSAKFDAAAAALGEGAFAVACDLARLEDIAQAVSQVRETCGRIDVLINCASTTRFGSAIALSDAEWVSGFEIKVLGALRLMRAAWPHLAETGGAIVNIGGVGARTPGFAHAMSGPLSAALSALTKAFADGGVAEGVRVNQINPGGVMTPRFADWVETRARAEGRSSADLAAEMARQGRYTRQGVPDDIAGMVAFLLSSEGELLQGAIIDMDGGMTKGL